MFIENRAARQPELRRSGMWFAIIWILVYPLYMPLRWSSIGVVMSGSINMTLLTELACDRDWLSELINGIVVSGESHPEQVADSCL